MLYLLGVVLFMLGLLASIALHEVGHLVPAKRSGVKVTQYMVGFGPTLWSRRRGETEYGIKAIPLGGYIRMIGMFPPRRDRGEDETHLRAASTGWMRAMVEEARTAEIDRIGPDDADRVFYKQPVRRKLLIMLGGPTMNLLIGVGILTILMTTYGIGTIKPVISEVSECVVAADVRPVPTECPPNAPATPAAEAGVQPGDRVVAFNGVPVTEWDLLTDEIRAAAGRPSTLVVERAGQRLSLDVTPVRNVVASKEKRGEYLEAGFLGVSPTLENAAVPVAEVPGQLWTYLERTAAAVVRVPQRMVDVWHAAFDGADRDPEGPVGVVGVSRLGGEVAALNTISITDKAATLVGLIAGLNLALFFFNLIPLLPLDGGHAAGAVFEGVRRQVARVRRRPDPGPADVARMLPVAYAVSIALIAMSVLLVYADIVNPIRLQ